MSRFSVIVCILIVLGLCLVFFFKQKTAYEMRISDWSSDVCSSDLGDDVSVFAHLVRVGTTSMTIDVEAWRRARHSEESHRVTQAKFVFVAVDEERRPRRVPPMADAV